MQRLHLGWSARWGKQRRESVLRNLERDAQFKILLALHCAVVSNRLFGWRTLDLVTFES